MLYLCFENNKLISLLSIRYELPKNLAEIYGDIGYGVRPSEKNKGYATAMHGCYKDNLNSIHRIGQ